MQEHIHESNLIEGYDIPAYDKQSMRAWKYLEKQDHLSATVLCNLQKLIVTSQNDLKPEWIGHLRNIPVWVGGHPLPNPEQVRVQLHQWIIDMQIEKDWDPKEMHVRFEKIHPFVDGNGRTGRMLMWWHEIKIGKEPTFIEFDDRQDYYWWFR